MNNQSKNMCDFTDGKNRTNGTNGTNVLQNGQYHEQRHDELYVVACVFNPRRFESRIRLFHEFESYVRASGAKLFVVEAAFGDPQGLGQLHQQQWWSVQAAAFPMKTLTIIGLALVASVINLPAQVSNNVPPSLPAIVGVTNVAVNVTVQPVVLTQAQMDATINLVQTAGGIQSNVPINTTNLQRLSKSAASRW